MEETKEIINYKSDDIGTKIIKHLVISGGGVNGLTFYGVLRESNKNKFWELKNIKTIYATSVGSILGVLLSLNYEWEITDNYFIKRPWNEVFNFKLQNILNSFDNCGIFNVKVIEEILKPLLNGKDIPIYITMKEFYDLTNIELHFFSTELKSFEITDFSYKTHPEWKLIDIVYCSCCLPILFSPFLINDKIYVDGGVLYNNPLKYCILNNNNINTNEIFCINKNIIYKKINIDINSTLFDYILFFIYKIIDKITNINTPKIKNQINILTGSVSLYSIFLASTNKEERIKLIEMGSNFWNDFEQ
jgi:predicted acylesterase/phospholipase RssA